MRYDPETLIVKKGRSVPHSHTSIHYTGKAYDMQAVAPWKKRSVQTERCRLSKKWLAPLFRGVHSSLAPTARPGSYARKPLLRKAFCGFDAHVAKSDQSLRGLRPPNPRGFFDRLGKVALGHFSMRPTVRAPILRSPAPPGSWGCCASPPSPSPTAVGSPGCPATIPYPCGPRSRSV